MFKDCCQNSPMRPPKELSSCDCIPEMRRSPEVPAVLADYARLYDLAIVPMQE